MDNFSLFNRSIERKMKDIGYEVDVISQSNWTNFFKDNEVKYRICTYVEYGEFVCELYSKKYMKLETFKTKE